MTEQLHSLNGETDIENRHGGKKVDTCSPPSNLAIILANSTVQWITQPDAHVSIHD